MDWRAVVAKWSGEYLRIGDEPSRNRLRDRNHKREVWAGMVDVFVTAVDQPCSGTICSAGHWQWLMQS